VSDGHLESQKNPDQLKRSIHVDHIDVQSTFVYIYAGLRVLMIVQIVFASEYAGRQVSGNKTTRITERLSVRLPVVPGRIQKKFACTDFFFWTKHKICINQKHTECMKDLKKIFVGRHW